MKTCVCTDCKQKNPQPLTAFYKDPRKKDGMRGECKECFKAHRKLRHSANPTKYRPSYLKRKYKLTPQQYDLMLSQQGGSCAICGRKQSEFKSRFAVDHNHATVKVRGLLCSDCNIAIGLLQDNPLILTKAIEYLTK
jgi:hypothetical protein